MTKENNQTHDSTQTYQKLAQAKATGLYWFRHGNQGILECSSKNYFNFILISWVCFALLGWLLSLAFATRTEFVCQRQDAQVGSCEFYQHSLHPFRIFTPSVSKYALSDIKGASVLEIIGDESDSYEVHLKMNKGSVHLLSPWTEAEAEDDAEEIDFFLKTPTESDLRLSSLNWVYLILFDLPIWFLTFQLLAALILKKAGRPFKSQRLIIDPDQRQVIKLRVSAMGRFHVEKLALGSVSKLDCVRSESENSVTYQYQLHMKQGKKENIFSSFALPSGVSESYLDDLSHQFNQYLRVQQSKKTEA